MAMERGEGRQEGEFIKLIKQVKKKIEKSIPEERCADMLEEDIAAARFYICEQDGGIAAAFCFHTQGDPPYRTIHDGAWLDDAPYGVVHRIASARTVKGAGNFA